MNISGSVAVVTGAGSGIGLATAKALTKAGATVHLADIRGDDVTQAARELGGTAHVIDVSDPDAVAHLRDQVIAQAGRVDLLHNNAGIAVGLPVDQMTLEDWHRVLGVNLNGVIHGVHHFAPVMIEQGGGVIVNTASILGLVGVPFSSAYCTSKFAVVGLSESLDTELAPRGVRVLAVCPGLIDTAIVARGKVDIPGRTQAQLEERWRGGSSPDVVAAAVLRAVEGGHRRTLVPFDAKVLYATRWLPSFVRRRLFRAGKTRI